MSSSSQGTPFIMKMMSSTQPAAQAILQPYVRNPHPRSRGAIADAGQHGHGHALKLVHVCDKRPSASRASSRDRHQVGGSAN